MNIPCDISAFIQTVSAGGVISLTNKVATISAPSGESTRIDKHILADAGCSVRCRVFARAVSGSGGSLTIDYLPIDRGGDAIRITSTEWREYTASFTVPLNVPDNQRITFGMGKFAADATGSAMFHSPRFEVMQTMLGAPRILGRGLIRLAAGVPSLSLAHQQDGIDALSYDAATATLSITMRQNNGAALHLSPLLFPVMTDENTTAAGRLTEARPIDYDPTTGIATIRFINGSTGAIQDVTGLGTVSLNFQAQI